MKTFLCAAFTLLFLFSQSYADDIYLKNGIVYKNVQILESSTYYYKIMLYPKVITNIDRIKVIRIERFPVDPSAKSIVTRNNTYSETELNEGSADPCNDKVFLQLKAKDSLTVDEMKAYIEFSKLCEQSKLNSQSNGVISNQRITTYPNMPWIIVGIASAGGAYYFFRESSDYSDAADLAKSLRLDSSDELTNKANMNLIAGIGCAVLSLVTTIVAIQPVEVTRNNDGFAVSYKLPI